MHKNATLMTAIEDALGEYDRHKATTNLAAEYWVRQHVVDFISEKFMQYLEIKSEFNETSLIDLWEFIVKD